MDKTRLPKHIAFIPDGNRRWAKKNKLSVVQGHQKGADNLIEIVKAAKAFGIPAVTFYGFSTENWTRDSIEVKALVWLLESYLINQKQTMLDNGIRFNAIGDISRFPKKVQKVIRATEQDTAHCADVDMIMGLNYGARDELRRACMAIFEDLSKSNIKKEDVSETLISRYLDTKRWPDPDFVIRTGGEKRLSNFLLWQTSYAEMYFSELMWPEFSHEHLKNAILEFQLRDRRLGGP